MSATTYQKALCYTPNTKIFTAMKTSNIITLNFWTTGDFGVQPLIDFFKKYTYYAILRISQMTQNCSSLPSFC